MASIGAVRMKTDAEKSRDAVLAERKRCAAIARKFGEDQGNWGAEAYDAGAAIAEEIERGAE